MVYLLRVRSSGWSLRIILQHGGGGARSETRPLAPPPPCWRLILLDTQAQQYGGGCQVEGRGRGGSNRLNQNHVSGPGWCLKVRSSSLFSQRSFYPPLFFPPTFQGQTLTPTCCSSSLTKGTISEPHWFEASISWLCFPHPELLMGTLAIKKFPEPIKSRRERNKRCGKGRTFLFFFFFFRILVKISALHLLLLWNSSSFSCARTFVTAGNRSHSTKIRHASTLSAFLHDSQIFTWLCDAWSGKLTNLLVSSSLLISHVYH